MTFIIYSWPLFVVQLVTVLFVLSFLGLLLYVSDLRSRYKEVYFKLQRLLNDDAHMMDELAKRAKREIDRELG